jgi:hypothetical protein
MRRSESPPPVPPHFVAFARPVSRLHPCFDPVAAGCVGRGPGVGDPVPPAGIYREDGGASQVPGEPRCERALFFDPGGIVSARPSRRHDAAFRTFNNVGSRGYIRIGAQWHGPLAGCLRFAGRVAPAPRKTRFRSLAKLSRAGVDTPQGPYERFRRYDRFLLPQAFLAH